jgi:zeta-carotene desaturase
LVLATLNDSSENSSMKYAAKVFYELFLKNRSGGRLGIPTIPLSDFYAAVADRILAHGSLIELRAGVEQIAQQADGRWLLRSADRDFIADDVILALPFEQTQRLLASTSLTGGAGEDTRRDLLAKMERFAHSPYISVLLWLTTRGCSTRPSTGSSTNRASVVSRAQALPRAQSLTSSW